MQLRTRLLALPLALGLALGPSAPTATAEVGDPAKAASAVSWLTRQTNADGMLASSGTSGDPGLPRDAATRALAADAPAATIDGWLRAAEPKFKQQARYEANGVTVQHTGLIAKALLTLDSADRNIASYGGIDLAQATLDSLTLGSRPGWAGSPNRLDGVNAFDQAYVMLGLSRLGTLPATTVSFLAGEQCSGGGFPMYFQRSTCKADPDGTALLVMALRGAKAQGIAAADAPLAKAVTWLAAQQEANGSYRGAEMTPEQNTNTSGLVAAALSDLKPTHVAKIRDWVGRMQLQEGGSKGAVAKDNSLLFEGVTASNRGTWVRSTAQGLLAFAPVSFHQLEKGASPAPSPKPPYDYVRTVPYTVPGKHLHNGRQWLTSCEPYSQTERCRTEIFASVVVQVGGQYQVRQGWVFNNLTYLPSHRSLWRTNPLGKKAEWTAADGRRWRTECDTVATGKGGCRSYATVTVVAATAKPEGGYTYTQRNDWVFNNIVLFIPA